MHLIGFNITAATTLFGVRGAFGHFPPLEPSHANAKAAELVRDAVPRMPAKSAKQSHDATAIVSKHSGHIVSSPSTRQPSRSRRDLMLRASHPPLASDVR